MKKLLLILLCLPMIGFGQACQYGSSTDASELCDFYRGNNFATYRNADIALDKILDVTGMSKRFVLKECNDISNCLATTYKGIRYILYDRDFMDAIATRTNSWSSTSILAHEIGHHVNGHTLGKESTLSESRQMELEADEYSGFVLFKLGASLSEAQEAIRVYGSDKDDSYSTHPKRDKRLRAIEKGYNKAKGQGSNNDYSTNRSTLTAEDYFYIADEYFEKGMSLFDLYEFDKSLNNQLVAMTKEYNETNDYELYQFIQKFKEDMEVAMNTKREEFGVRHDTKDYYNKAVVYLNQAIEELSKSIKLNSEVAPSYKNRGIAKENAGLPYCSDYKRACDLGDEECCEWYNNQCE